MHDLQTFSNIEEENLPFALSMLGIGRETEKYSVFFGIRNVNEDYFTSPCTSLFTNSSCGIFPTLSAETPLANYPVASVGFDGKIRWNRWQFQLSVYNGTGNKQLTGKENVLKNYKEVVADYITEKYQKYGNITNEEEKENATREFQEYVNLKEKGIAIDAKILLEEVQNKFEEKFIKQNEEQKVSEEEMFRQSRTMNTLYNYARFFDLIKNGRELNARIYAAKLVKIDFSIMKKIFNNFHKDEELLKYIDLKEEEIREMQDETYVLSVSTYEDYNKDSVKELNSFLIRSSIREHTRQDDEEKILDTFDQMKVELIKHNIEALKKYNYYAEKNGLYTCSLPKEDDKKGEVNPISTTLQKMYEISDEEFENVINPIIPDER